MKKIEEDVMVLDDQNNKLLKVRIGGHSTKHITGKGYTFYQSPFTLLPLNKTTTD